MWILNIWGCVKTIQNLLLLIAHVYINPNHLPVPGEDEGMGGALPPIGIGRSLPRIIDNFSGMNYEITVTFLGFARYQGDP